MKKYRFRLRLLPTILFSALVILIVRAHSYSMGFENMPDIPISSFTELWDVFSYVKASAIFYITIYAAASMGYLLLVGRMKIKKTIIYIPMLVYVAGVVISYILSDYKWMALLGSVNRFEGTRTIICYMFMMFYTINVIDEWGDALAIVISTIVSVFCTCIIGSTQLFGHDFFFTKIGEMLVTGNGDISMDAVFLPGQVYQTVANMYYVSMYLALVVPVLIYGIYYFCQKKNRLGLTERGIYLRQRQIIVMAAGILLVMIALNVIGAGSLGGVLGIIASIAVLLIVISGKKWQKVVVTVSFVLIFSSALAIVYVKGSDNRDGKAHRQIDYIETDVDRVSMSVDGEEINILYDRNSGGYALTDSEGESVPIFWFADEEEIIQVDDDRFAGKIRLIPLIDENGMPCVAVEVLDNGSETFGFTFYEDGAKYLNPFGEEVALSKVESFGFDGHLSAGSGRGYIWSRTLPLIKESLFFGSGADTFMVVFPQNDYAGKYSSGTLLATTYSKPHSMYLNMAVGSGVISLIVFLAMVGMVLWKAFHLGEDKKYIKVIAAGIVGFLIAGLFNDSTVCVMPMFYGLLGTVAGGIEI